MGNQGVWEQRPAEAGASRGRAAQCLVGGFSQHPTAETFFFLIITRNLEREGWGLQGQERKKRREKERKERRRDGRRKLQSLQRLKGRLHGAN